MIGGGTSDDSVVTLGYSNLNTRAYPDTKRLRQRTEKRENFWVVLRFITELNS